jgi:hypothetical protein
LGTLSFIQIAEFIFPAQKNLFVLIIFFIPTISFWVSGIRAEGLILLFMALTIYYSVKWLIKPRASYAILTVIGLAGILGFRGVFLLAFIPGFVSWILTNILKRKPLYVFFIVYALAAIVFFGSAMISDKTSLPATVVSRQQEFFQLHAKTVLPLDSLRPSVQSFLKISPQAFSNSLLRPFIWEARGVLQVASAVGVLGFWIMFLLMLFWHEKNWIGSLVRPISLLCLFYGFSLVLLIGFVVPFPGAIARYNSIPELFMIIAFAITIKLRAKFKL